LPESIKVIFKSTFIWAYFIVFQSKEVLNQMVRGGLHIFGGIGAFGDFGVPTL